jgi:O-antigen/teichoic acid export membrane protein/glycosyltransferase involved in cell wall biosynthesis
VAKQSGIEGGGKLTAGILRNALWLAWSGSLSIANGVVLWAALARWREAAELGRFTAVIGIYTIFTTLCSLGIGPYLSREVARRKERRQLVASAAALIGGWSVLSAAGMAVTGWIVCESSPARWSALILSAAMLPAGLISVAEATFTALGRARVIALATTTENLLRTAIPLWLLYRGYSLPVICLSLVAMRATACAAYAMVVRRHLPALLSATWQIAREILSQAPTFAAVNILATVHWQLGAVLVSRWGGDEAAAEFGVASRFLVPVAVLLASYASVVQPAAARLATVSIEAMGEFLARGLRLIIALALPTAVGAMLLGRELLSLLFGERYAGAAPALGLFAASVIPFGVVMIASRGLIATGRQRIDLLGNLVAVIVNVAGNFILIPRFGAAGAAAAQLLSLSAMAAVEVLRGTDSIFPLGVWRAIWICRWPLAAMAALVWQARKLGFAQALVVGSASYLIGLGLIWGRLNPRRSLSDANSRPRVLMVGAHLTRTLGGITTMIKEILNSPLAEEFEFRHIESQADESGRIGKLTLAIEALVKFVAAILLWRPHVAYVHVGGNASLYRKIPFIALARLLGCQAVTHFHAGDFDFYYDKQSRFGRWLIRRGLGLSHRLIAVSEALGKRLHELEHGKKVSVVPNGIETAVFGVQRASSTGCVRLLFVGAMGRLKGERDLTSALNAVVPFEPSLRVMMLGHGVEKIRPSLERSVAWPRIEHLGPVAADQRISFFKHADIFVLPTYAEGMPVSVLEAMAAGLPVITTPVGGIPELIEDGVEGFLISPGDVQALEDRIALLVGDAKLRQRMGARARLKAQQFDESIMMERLGELLRQVAAQSSATSPGEEANNAAAFARLSFQEKD